MISYLFVKLAIGGLSLGGGYYVLKKIAIKESKKELQLEQISEDIEERVEEDLSD